MSKGKNDAWQLGAKREISFQVIGYSEQALTQKVQVIVRISKKKKFNLRHFDVRFARIILRPGE